LKIYPIYSPWILFSIGVFGLVDLDVDSMKTFPNGKTGNASKARSLDLRRFYRTKLTLMSKGVK
jgi:hypothetical protein